MFLLRLKKTPDDVTVSLECREQGLEEVPGEVAPRISRSIQYARVGG